MKYTAKSGVGFCDAGMVYEAPVVARKMNGYILAEDGGEIFVSPVDIDILEISDKEKNMPIRWDW